MADIYKPKYFPRLIVKVPGHGVMLRHPTMVLNPTQQAFLESRGMVEALEGQSADSSEPDIPTETETLENSLIVGGQVVTDNERLILVGFFNNPGNKTDALKIAGIKTRTMNEIESARPLAGWDAIANILNSAQLESAILWLRENYQAG